MTVLHHALTANSNKTMETTAKSKIEMDDDGGLLNDPFELFEEWRGEADSQAYQAWSAPELEMPSKGAVRDSG